MHPLARTFWACLAAALAVSIMAGSVLAGTESIFSDGINYRLNADTAFIAGTTDDPAKEIATVQASVRFETNPNQTFAGMRITFMYNPTYLDLVDWRPTDAWQGIDPSDYSISDQPDGDLRRVNFMISYASNIPTSVDWTALAEFDFQLLCQPETQSNSLPIQVGQSVTEVTLNNLDVYYIDNHALEASDGSVAVADYTGELWLGDVDSVMDFEGVLGDTIRVPVIVQANYMVGHVIVSFNYNHQKLQLLGLGEVQPIYAFPSAQVMQTDLIRVQLLQVGHEMGCPDPTVMANIKFLVLSNWEGDSAKLSISDYVTPMIQSPVCGALIGAGQLYHGCRLNIANYAAAFSTEFTDGGKIGLHDDQVSMMIKMTNNFPAGRDWKSIIANVCLGNHLEKDGPISYEAINFGSLTNDEGANGQEVTLWTEAGSGFMPISATPQDMVAINIETVDGFTPPTTFDNRLYSINYQTPFDSDPSYNARVKDTTGRVSCTQGASLTWDSPQVEYLMGEYYCPSVQAGSGLISQDFFTRSSFDLHDFRVKVVVSGNHSIYDVALQPGVVIEELDSTYFKWVIFGCDPTWEDQAATATRVKFATITYAYWTQNHMLQLENPGNGHWVTKSSTVSFVYDSPTGFFMNNPSDQDQHEVAIGGSVVSQWWVPDFPDPDPLNYLAGPNGLPKEFALLQNYPNPFNPTTEFWYALPEGAWVEVSIYNITGQKVVTLTEGWREAGFYNATWNGEDVASGVYFYRIMTDKFTESKKMILLK